MAPRKATYVGLACLGLVSAAPGAADGGVTTLKLKRGAAAEEHPDTAVLREVHFIRRRYEEARALLELEGAEAETALRRAVRLLGANVKHWEAIEAFARNTQVYEEAVLLIARNRATLGQAFYRSGHDNAEMALEELEAACPVLWEAQRTRRKPAGGQLGSRQRSPPPQQSQQQQQQTRAPSSSAGLTSALLSSSAGTEGAQGGSEAADSWLTCYATLANLHAEVEAKKPNGGKGGRRAWTPPSEMMKKVDGSGSSLSQQHALKLQTLAMINKLSLLSQTDSSKVGVAKRVVWGEAKAMRTQLNEIVRQYSSAITAAEQRSLLDRAQAWVMITETDAQRVLAKVRAEVRAEEQQQQQEGGGREAAALSKAEEAEAASLMSELLREGGHYLSVMEGIAAKGWSFVVEDLRHVSETVYDRLQKNGHIETPEGFQSRLDVLKIFSYIHFGPDSIGPASTSTSTEPTAADTEAESSSSSSSKRRPRARARASEERRGPGPAAGAAGWELPGVVSSLLVPGLVTLLMTLVGWLLAAPSWRSSSRSMRGARQRAVHLVAASRRQQGQQSGPARRRGLAAAQAVDESSSSSSHGGDGATSTVGGSSLRWEAIRERCSEWGVQLRQVQRHMGRRGSVWWKWVQASWHPAWLLAWLAKRSSQWRGKDAGLDELLLLQTTETIKGAAGEGGKGQEGGPTTRRKTGARQQQHHASPKIVAQHQSRRQQATSVSGPKPAAPSSSSSSSASEVPVEAVEGKGKRRVLPPQAASPVKKKPPVDVMMAAAEKPIAEQQKAEEEAEEREARQVPEEEEDVEKELVVEEPDMEEEEEEEEEPTRKAAVEEKEEELVTGVEEEEEEEADQVVVPWEKREEKGAELGSEGPHKQAEAAEVEQASAAGAEEEEGAATSSSCCCEVVLEDGVRVMAVSARSLEEQILAKLEGAEEAKAGSAPTSQPVSPPHQHDHSSLPAQPQLPDVLVAAAAASRARSGKDHKKRASWVNQDMANTSATTTDDKQQQQSEEEVPRSAELGSTDEAQAPHEAEQQRQVVVVEEAVVMATVSEGVAPLAAEEEGSASHEDISPPPMAHHQHHQQPHQMVYYPPLPPPHHHYQHPHQQQQQPSHPMPPMPMPAGMPMMMPPPPSMAPPPMQIQAPVPFVAHRQAGPLHITVPPGPPPPHHAAGPGLPPHMAPRYAAYQQQQHSGVSPFPSPTGGQLSPQAGYGSGPMTAAMAFGRTPSPPLYNPPASMPPPPSPMTRELIEEALQRQICYYFSVENLCKDLYLRNKMDADGFVSLAEIANFNRIRQITQDIRLVVSSIQSTPQLELQMPWSVRAVKGSLADTSVTALYHCKVRTRDYPERWVIRSNYSSSSSKDKPPQQGAEAVSGEAARRGSGSSSIRRS